MDGEPWSEEKYQMTLAAQQKEAGLLAGILAARGITDPAEALTCLLYTSYPLWHRALQGDGDPLRPQH